ncbi:hypothetical protein [Citrobacter europaeus]|uniref:hypothetical protein n=1 Tax=Citrobacter europaeus TaxID=1914243 RepID=UPI00397967D3
MFNFLKTLNRIINQKPTQEVPQEYSTEQLLQWAIGCMLEGLPDKFYEARISCFRNIDNEGRTAIASIHDVKLTIESEYTPFSPPDALYATHCIEKILAGNNWSQATITFNPETTTFTWE